MSGARSMRTAALGTTGLRSYHASSPLTVTGVRAYRTQGLAVSGVRVLRTYTLEMTGDNSGN